MACWNKENIYRSQKCVYVYLPGNLYALIKFSICFRTYDSVHNAKQVYNNEHFYSTSVATCLLSDAMKHEAYFLHDSYCSYQNVFTWFGNFQCSNQRENGL